MHRIIWVLFFSAGMAGSVPAQDSPFEFSEDSFTNEIGKTEGISSDEEPSSSTSQEYRSYQQTTDTKSLVHRNATIRADQRRRRLATRKWFGYSKSRPIVAAVPFMTHYSPLWTSNPWSPYGWYGTRWP